MKLRKILVVLAIMAVMMTFLAIFVNAEEVQINSDFIESIVASEGNGRTDYLSQFFDGNIATGGIYDGATGWYGNVGEYVIVTLKAAMPITNMYIYLTGNYTFGNLEFLDENGQVVHTVSTLAEGGAYGPDAINVPVFEASDATPSILVKSIKVTVTALKWGDGRTYKIHEMEITAIHEHSYSKLENIVQLPTCSNPGVGVYSCICGLTDEGEISATGMHTTEEFIAFRNGFTQPGALVSGCPTCDTQDVPLQEIGALFTPLGYSVSETGTNGIYYGFAVNYESIATYTELAGYGVEFGVVAYSTAAFTGETALLNSPDGVIGADSTVICKNMTSSGYGLINYKINGFADSYKDTEFVLGGYVSDGVDIYYLGNTSSLEPVTVSYNGILNSIG